MRLKIDRLKIVATTPEGQFGADISLGNGLNVLRASNSSGKSTLANGILYGLGLEGMLGPDWPRPLKYALYDKLTDNDGAEHRVQESHVLLEISNDRGEAWTIKRQVHGDLDTDLVQLWQGHAVSDPGSERPAGDAFVRTPGSASREAGFHTRLARFIGWELPQVVTFEGGQSLLYLQLLFPLLFVEQSRGWSGVRKNVPRFLRVRDPDLRAVQFLLDLDAGGRLQQREEIEAAIAELRARWTSALAELRGSLRGESATLEGVPEAPTATWPPEPAPTLLVRSEDERIPISDALVHLQARLRELREQELPKVAAVARETQGKLVELEQRQLELTAARSQFVGDVAAEEADLRRIDERLAALEVDRKRHRDARHVVNLGGAPVAQLQEGRCPTCDQYWPEDLLGGDVQAVMTFEDNIAVIEQEQRALKALRVGAAASLDDRRAQLAGLTDSLIELQADVRAHRDVLQQDGRAPSAAAVRERLSLETRIERLTDLEVELDHLVERLAPLSRQHRELREQREALKGGDLSQPDAQKVNAWERSLLDQLRDYHFRSIDHVQLSRQTLLPEREGFDLTYEASASDTIRLIWAYLLGLLETARQYETNHPGLLVFDEPGQQDVEDRSVRALMQRAAESADADQQVIITITRGVEDFMTPGLAANIVDFPDGQRVLRRLD